MESSPLPFTNKYVMRRPYIKEISARGFSYINYIKEFRISICLAEIFQHYLTASAMFQGGALEDLIKKKAMLMETA